jgi:hypothetical protein
MEIWKPIQGYEGIYEVSNTGKIRSSKGKETFSKLHGTRVWTARELKLKTDKYGYKRICLYKDKKPKDFLVHRLVALAFIDKKEGKEIINHIDCNPANNHFNNLEWVDYKENLKHAYLNGLNKAPKKVSIENELTGDKKEFYSMAEASRFLNKSHGYISDLFKKGKSKVGEYKIKLEG